MTKKFNENLKELAKSKITWPAETLASSRKPSETLRNPKLRISSKQDRETFTKDDSAITNFAKELIAEIRAEISSDIRKTIDDQSKIEIRKVRLEGSEAEILEIISPEFTRRIRTRIVWTERDKIF